MKFSLNWLKTYLNTDATADKISTILDEIGLEVENIQNIGLIYSAFKIAYIETTTPHPMSDKLKICTVNDGKNLLQIVCGAPNARAGIKVVLAPIGTQIPANQIIIKKQQIRSIESQGMLCSAEELLLDADTNANGIMELDSNWPIGASYADYANLNDTIFEIALTPNRGDCASIYGIARDLSATGIGTLSSLPTSSVIEQIKFSTKLYIKDTENCTEFCMRYIANVDNHTKLTRITDLIRTTSNTDNTALVNISNFSMLEFGRPNHIYDADKIKGDITVRKSLEGEQFIAIGGKSYILPANITVVADNTKILAIAGVIGGELSKVDIDTKNILIEVANFKPQAVTISGRALNIITESRFRFERRVDYANTKFFIDYLTSLIVNNCGGQVSNIQKYENTRPEYISKLSFDFAKCDEIAGYLVNRQKATSILNSLGFELIGSEVLIPSWRQGDISSQACIVEEILRIDGFNNITAIDLPITPNTLSIIPNDITSCIKQSFLARGLNEVITWSFSNKTSAEIFGYKDSISIANPIHADFSLMRQNIIPNIILILQKNISRGYSDLAIFEIGNIYSEQYNNRQALSIAGLRSGYAEHKNIHNTERKYDFYDAKEDIKLGLSSIGLKIDSVKLTRNVPKYYHPSKSAAFNLGSKILGYCGELHPKILNQLNLNLPVVIFELIPDNIPLLKSKTAKTSLQLSNYQAVNRDFAFVVDRKILFAEFVSVIRSLKIDIISNINIFDIYEGSNIEQGKKSIAFNITLQPKDKTLTDLEITNISDQIIDSLQHKLGASLRV